MEIKKEWHIAYISKKFIYTNIIHLRCIYSLKKEYIQGMNTKLIDDKNITLSNKYHFSKVHAQFNSLMQYKAISASKYCIFQPSASKSQTGPSTFKLVYPSSSQWETLRNSSRLSSLPEATDLQNWYLD